MTPACEVITRQAVPTLIDSVFENMSSLIRDNPAGYLTTEVDTSTVSPIYPFVASLPKLASPYCNFVPEYRGFVLRDIEDMDAEDQFYDYAHSVAINGFRKTIQRSWAFYYPSGYEGRNDSKGRTYITLPGNNDAMNSLMNVADVIEETLGDQTDVHLKVSDSLESNHSIVIYDDDSEKAQEGLSGLVEKLTTDKVKLAPRTMLTANPVIPGVGSAPDVPAELLRYYRDKTGSNAPSWSQVAGLALLTSVKYALSDSLRQPAQLTQEEITEVARNGAGKYFGRILDEIGIDPVTYKIR